MSASVKKENQIKYIMECRQSGLSDYQWCKVNQIYPGTFYNWVSKLKKKGYTFPDSKSKSVGKPVIQEIVKLDVIEHTNTNVSKIKQSTNYYEAVSSPQYIAAELLIGNVTIKLFNGADTNVINNTLQFFGGNNYVR